MLSVGAIVVDEGAIVVDVTLGGCVVSVGTNVVDVGAIVVDVTLGV